MVGSLDEGYQLLRGEHDEERIVVSDAEREVYEAMHYELPTTLQHYGRLGADIR